LLALSGQRVSRHEAAVKRAQAQHQRQHATIKGRWRKAYGNTRPCCLTLGKAIERARALREQAPAAMEALAANEEALARLHEQLAARNPERRDEYQRTAEQARTSARKARQIVRTFTA
jgi:hypothetical protein